MSSEEAVQRELLEAIITADSEERFSEALSAHGAVRDEELPELVARTESWDATTRRNATRLLTLARNRDQRDGALRRLVRDTDDVEVWATALDALLDAPDAEALASARPEMIDQALEADEARVLSAGLRAAALARRPGTEAMLEQRLHHPDRRVRAAVLEALGSSGPGALEGQLKEMLARRPDPSTLRPLLEILVASNDPATQEAVRQAYLAADKDAQNTYSLVFRDSDQPWVRQFWLALARKAGPDRARALHILGSKPEPELIRLCVELYEKTPPKGDPGYVPALLERGPCDNVISQLAGKRIVGEDALAFAREWLASRS